MSLRPPLPVWLVVSGLHKHIHTPTHIHTHTYTHTLKYTHTHMHAYIHAQEPRCRPDTRHLLEDDWVLSLRNPT